MSTVSTPFGVANTQIYDYAYVTGLDMEPYQAGFQSGNPGVWTNGANGYIELNITQISWAPASGSPTLSSVTDNIFINLDVAGYDPERMSAPTDGTAANNPIQNYLISSASGSINFSSSSTTPNQAKYLWAVVNGVVQNAVLNEDNTFTGARLVASIQQNNVVPSGENIVFTITYTLTFTSLDSTISSASTSSTANLAVNLATPSVYQILDTSAITAPNSGYVFVKFGNIATTSTIPIRSNDAVPNLNDDPPAFFATLHDGTLMWSQYTARAARTKNLSAVTNKVALFVVNQGKIGRNAELVNNVYNLVKLKLMRNNSDDFATVALNYNITSTTV
jgi:hypothetical protein